MHTVIIVIQRTLVLCTMWKKLFFTRQISSFIVFDSDPRGVSTIITFNRQALQVLYDVLINDPRHPLRVEDDETEVTNCSYKAGHARLFF